MTQLLNFYATCPRGLEALLVEDLTAAGGRNIVAGAGGVHFQGDWAACYRANLESRIASRILWKLGQGRYRNEQDIYDLAYKLDWHELFSVDCTMRGYITAVRSPLRSVDFVTLKVKDAVCDRFRRHTGTRPNINTNHPQVRYHTFLTEDEVTFYLDTSGQPLYKRGFKLAVTEAPLKENLAAGILRLSGWDKVEPLADPMCGSGTFLIEAALMALDVAPGLGRRFGFEKFKLFDADLWQQIRSAAEARRQPCRPLPIYGSDLMGDQIRGTKQNLEAAGLEGVVSLKQGNVLEVPAPAESGVLVTNPPYGVRLQSNIGQDAFYPLLGDALKRKWSGWRCYLLSADLPIAKLIGLKASKRTPLYNGALECRLFEYKIVSGQNRGA